MPFIKLKPFFLFLLIATITINYAFCQEEKMENKIETTKALGKDAIIKQAISILKNKYPDLNIKLEDYEITAWANKKEVIVNFHRILMFTPLKEQKATYYNLTINILTQNINPFDAFGTSGFYVPTAEDVIKIETLKKQVAFKADFINEVKEQADTYFISISNDSYFYNYEIDKSTGEIIENSEIQGHWEPEPQFEEDAISNKDPLVKLEQ